MGKRLIVAEKPSVGRDIANVLNCRENGNGCRKGENDIVTWAVGHLVGLCYPDEMDERYIEWRLEDLPIFPNPFQLKVLGSSEKQYEIIKALMNDPEIDTIVCATDAGREGELIFRYIYQLAGCTKPVERLWISSLTYRAIKEGFENLKPDSEYDTLYESARCRSEADWLIGMNGSRAYAIENHMKRLSVGRVLSPTLSILVRRELERRQFRPEQYCEVVAKFDGYDGRLLNPDKKRDGEMYRFPIAKKADLDNYVKKHSPIGTIVYSEYEEEKQPPQQLYDLTSLQRDANRLFGMSSKWTLDTAQSLYEKHKAITYPRTDSRYLSSDIKSTLQKRLESLLNSELESFVTQALSSDRDLFGRFIYNKGVSDHHAIIPTGEPKGMDSWTKQEKRIYDLIARRFIGMFLQDRVVLHQKLKTVVDGREFLSIGEEEIEAGWSAVDISRRSRMQTLPNLEEGETIPVLGMRVRTDETKPPAPHTEASLLAAMEHAGKIVPEDSTDDVEIEYGIGTPATRAATIEKIIDKEMAVRKGRALVPTEYGIKLISILPEVLQSPEMTGEWEAKLSRISKGDGDPSAFMAELHELTKDVVNYAIQKGDTGITQARSVGTCPVCGDAVREYDNSYYCVNRNCKFRGIYKVVKGQYPILHSITMRELLANGIATTEKGTYKLEKKPPFITFEYSPKPVPDYRALAELIAEYGLEPINKVSVGGGFWLAGDKHDELMKDFVKDCKETGCIFIFFEEARALRHKGGWCHRVEQKYLSSFEKVFAKSEQPTKTTENHSDCAIGDTIITLIQESGFEYVDKRENGGSLWIIAGESEAMELISKCKDLGATFLFTAKGGKASNKRPAWYSTKSHYQVSL